MGGLTLRLMDMHSGGDVSRIVTGGVAPLPGATVRQQMEFLRRDGDGLRRLLLSEPYGSAEMSVDLLVRAGDPAAETGYIIMEVMGYPIYSGSNTLCTATAALECGLVEKREGRQRFALEAPAGLVQVEAVVENGVVERVTCEGLPSYIHSHRDRILVPSVGEVSYSIAYSGGFYALVEAAELGFELVREEEPALARCAHAIVEALQAERGFSHYTLGELGPLPFLHFMGPVEQPAEDFYRSRSASYVHPGVICRGPTGTGTSARLALMDYEGALAPGDKLETVSLRNTGFIGQYVATERAGEHRLVRNTITGKAYLLARSEIVVNCDDAMVECSGLHRVLSGRGGGRGKGSKSRRPPPAGAAFGRDCLWKTKNRG